MSAAPSDRPVLPSPEAMEHAAAWFSLLQSGTATDADHVRWQAWRQSTADSRAAWALVERVSQSFQPMQHELSARLAADTLQTASARLARRRHLLGMALLAGSSGLLGWAMWQPPGAMDTLLAWGADYRTRPGERRDLQLTDGTQLWLGSATALDLDYRSDLRRLRLRHGDILIQTATDTAQRPFVVDTAQGRLQALGTRFNVRQDERNRTQLAVYAGAVQITLADSRASRILHAGQQVSFTATHIEAVTAADPAREAWSRGILLAQDMPLGEVIAELARYQRGRLSVAPEVAGLTVLGSYPLDDVNSALAMLQRTLPIQVRRPLPWWTRIEARP